MTFEEFVAQAERAWGGKIAREASRIWREQPTGPFATSYAAYRNSASRWTATQTVTRPRSKTVCVRGRRLPSRR
jgi:hypothetical protein